MMLLTGARVVTPSQVLEPGWVAVDGDRIREVGTGAPPPAGQARRLDGGWLVPGFVDIHVHGGGGAAFTSGTVADARRAAEFHLRRGTTTMFASLISAPLSELHATIGALAGLLDDGTLAGIHLEGPYLAARRCGAHDPAHLRAPDHEELADLLAAAGGAVRHVTLAPELPGALKAIEQIVDAGAVAAIGHTDATYDQARAAFDAGATIATHLHNGMPPSLHREPGPAVAALEDERVTVELINDGVHLHDATVRAAFARAGDDRVALVTDAMAAAGAADGRYRLGSIDVEVTHPVARVAGGASLAGSTLTMDSAFRRAVRDVGVPMVAVARTAALTPAVALGLDRVGAIAPGWLADLVVLDDDLEVHAVMRRGSWVWEAP